MENLKILKNKIEFILLILISLFSCDNIKSDLIKENSSIDNINYSELDYKKVYTSINSLILDEWLIYSELTGYINEINSGDLSSITENKKYLTRFFNGLKKTIPEIINEKEIISRITVIETNFLKYDAILSNNQVSKKRKISIANKINSSFSNLNYQIDKIIEKKEIIP